MAPNHSPAFLALVEDAKGRITEFTVDQIRQRQLAGESFTLVDVREESEWQSGHVAGAIHLGKGIIERDIESRIPEKDEDIVLYCGGGFRSALAADTLQKMGYTQVSSMDGGMREWRNSGYPEE